MGTLQKEVDRWRLKRNGVDNWREIVQGREKWQNIVVMNKTQRVVLAEKEEKVNNFRYG